LALGLVPLGAAAGAALTLYLSGGERTQQRGRRPGCSFVRPISVGPTAAVACPVTRPVPVSEMPPAVVWWASEGYNGPPGALVISMVGNDALWVDIPPNGESTGVPEGDGVFDKFGTLRLVEGQVIAVGRRLDGPAPPPTFSIPDGYGTKGSSPSRSRSRPWAAGRSPRRSLAGTCGSW
jgi:hypothetical protein